MAVLSSPWRRRNRNGPVDDVDLSRYVEGEPRSAWSQLAPSQQASLKRLVYEVKENDIIYVKQGPMIVGKGIVAGPYRFDKKNRIQEPDGTPWQHQHRVSWTPGFPEVPIQLGHQQAVTLVPLTGEDVKRIEQEVSRIFWLPADMAEQVESNDNPGYISQDVDRRRLVERQIRERRGQQQFRDVLRQRYKDRCLMTGCKVVAVLEAAHIDPYRGEDNNHPENGLLLRADIHTLFDLDLLGIEPDSLQVELHPGIAEEYGKLAGKTLGCAGKRRPSQEALRRRYEQFQKRAHQPA